MQTALLKQERPIKGRKGRVLIRSNKLSKYFGKNGEIKAVDELDLEILEGETFGLLGPNGAGKTTTIRLLNCILKPTSGDGSINGFDITEESMKVKAMTGLLAESPGVYDKLSAYEFLEFMAALYKVKKEIIKDRIDDLLELMELTERKDHLIEGFSTGMKQKVLIAAALIHDPPVLFFDEPTAGLDPRAAHRVRKLIENLADQAKKTIVICSHILPVVERLCDRIGIIDQGRLVAMGTVDEILAKTGSQTLEEAFISLTGGVNEKELLAWREHS